TLTVANNGPSTATGVTVTDPLPVGVSLLAAVPSQGTCSGTPTVLCSLGTLAPGATATVNLFVQATAPGTVVNTATATSDQFDPSPATASASTTINAVATPTPTPVAAAFALPAPPPPLPPVLPPPPPPAPALLPPLAVGYPAPAPSCCPPAGEVPVIPEADSLLLVGSALALLAGFATWRAGRRRDE